MTGCWTLQARDRASSARAGWLTTPGGVRLPTPLFQPVASAGSVRTLDWHDLRALRYPHLLMNTYHLVVHPGVEAIARAGGLKAYCGWPGSLLTDSGGYQVHSLAAKRSLGRDGVHFTDHLSGKRWHFTPRFVLEAQLAFGVDFAMCLDVCTGLPAGRNRVARELALTHAWAREQAELWPRLALGSAPRLLGIVQGGLYEDLRRESVELIGSLGFDGLAVGGLSVGETREDFRRLVSFTGARLPGGCVRYLMGVGEPADLLFAVAHGFDMFDCVQPTRMARHGVAFTSRGVLPLRRARFAGDEAPLDTGCRCRVCRTYSRSYLHHLLLLKEHSYARLLTWHNLAFYRDLLARMRRRILRGTYGDWWERQCDALRQTLPDGA